MLFLQVIICITLVIFIGSSLSQSADILAEKTGMGRTWVGTILLAGVTSLPELATGTSAIILFNSPDLAVGGILGSCLFNLLILALLDIYNGPEPVLQRAQISHGLAASLGCVMLGVTTLGILLAKTEMNLAVGWVGIPSIILLWLYWLSARMIAQFEIRRRAQVLEEEIEAFQYQHITSKQAYLRFIFLSVIIVILGIWLAFLGDRVAEVTGLGQSFIGAILLATATSLPEVVASLAAIRLNAVDLAVSNIFGSNITNLAILGVYDLVYLQGNLWLNISQIHIFTAIVAMIMTSVAINGLIYHAVSGSRMYITWDGLTLVALYIGAMYVIYWDIF
ncbi:sodium:calcium antiporter [Dolichospermum sp. UHCC 0259]|uniref:sodium:calcium antiporter n=1 Tax=Dolichospermum sp. UHCC 0259 TaxID=2590010 RepID=UPI001446AC05|nr:sodium:calcium antiporter [Dolichospermum sp. UHCC 0259]MTJ48079.1 sodium:calcium antiporter [Dolichospermum sp. UHCC 0259]